MLNSTGLRFEFTILSLCSLLVLTIGGCANSSPQSTTPITSSADTSLTSPKASITTNSSQKININKAPIAELDKLELPGTKPSLSERIQGHRPYSSLEDLVTKKAISQEELKLIRNLITLNGN